MIVYRHLRHSVHCFLLRICLGKVYSWGCNDEGALGRATSSEGGEEFTAGPVQGMAKVHVVMVSAGDSHTMALSDKGTVFGWGTYRVIMPFMPFFIFPNESVSCQVPGRICPWWFFDLCINPMNSVLLLCGICTNYENSTVADCVSYIG